MKWFVYFIKSAKNGKVYVGFTSKEINERVREHNAGLNAFTKHNGHWNLLYYEEYTCAACVRKRERFYKSGFGKSIKYLITTKIEENIYSGTGAIG